MLCTLLALLPFVALASWLVYLYLLAVPSPTPALDAAFLKGKIVWITGASSGIGKAMAEHVATLGVTDARVVLSARNEAALGDVAASLAAKGVKDVLVLPLDLAALADDMSLATAAAAAVAKRWNGRSVDVLIHNGGVSMRALALESAASIDVDSTLNKVNFLGAVALTKAVLPSMVAAGAKDPNTERHILCVSSVQGLVPIAARTAYAASKFAMHGWFHSLAVELADQHVRVCVLCPGYVRTEVSRNALRADGRPQGTMDRTTAGGYDPAYVAAVSFAALRQRCRQVIVADPVARLACLLQAIAPGILFPLLVRRARKDKLGVGKKDE